MCTLAVSYYYANAHLVNDVYCMMMMILLLLRIPNAFRLIVLVAYKLDLASGLPLWTGPVLSTVALSSTARIVLNFTEMSSQGGLALRNVKAPFSVDDGRGGIAKPSNNCTKCCDGGGAPFEVTFDSDPAGARQAGRNLTWIRLDRADIEVGADSVVLAHGQHGTAPTGVRYAWTNFVDCDLDNGNSSNNPARPATGFEFIPEGKRKSGTT